ncbi:MAG: AAA family ATPase [Clostridia bacterium]|nr:AAA family ATPase [Clostridia bacterium]
MRIVQIEIEEFGKLKDCHFAPDAGMNLFQGPNESGKSTLLAFLRFALYGFPRRSGPDAEERDKRLSWQNRRAAGTLTLEIGGSVCRISRSYTLGGSAKRPLPVEELSVISLPSGEALPLGERTPGEQLLGLPPELYDSSLCVRQSDLARVSAQGMGEAVEQLLFGDERSDAQSAERILENARRELQYRKGRGGKIAQCEDTLAQLDAALTRARADAIALEQLRAEIAQLRAQHAERQRELACVSTALESVGDAQVLADFAELHRARAQADCARRAWEQAQQRESALPDRSFFDTVGRLLHQCESAENEIAQHSPEVRARRSAPTDGARAAAATFINEQGGDAVILARFTRARARKRRCGWLGGASILLAVLSAVLSAFLPQICMAAAAAGGVLALVALALLGGAWHAHRAMRQLLRTLGVRDGTMLRTYLKQCRDEAARDAQNRQYLHEAELKLQIAEQSQHSALSALADAFAKAGYPMHTPSTDTARQLCSELAHQYAAAQGAVAAARMDFERAQGVADALGARLGDRDEAAIRARSSGVSYTESPETLREKRKLLAASVQTLEQQRAEAERRESALAAIAQDPVQLESERARVCAEYDEAKGRLAALELALTALDEAGQELRQNVMPTLARRASALFAALTEGAHDTLYLGADLTPSAQGAHSVLPLSHFSAGCRDAAHLALRLALLDTLTKEKMPLLLDEALARLDDDRARAVLSVLRAYCREGGQCLLFSCHIREAAWLADDAKVFKL